MRCELCGKPVFEKIFATVDNARLLVCPECAGAFGEDIKEFQEKTFAKKTQPARLERKPALQLDEGLDLRQDFGQLIRKKRQQAGLTIEELAKKIFEKESILHKVENQKLVPSDALIKKFEKALQVSLREKNSQ